MDGKKLRRILAIVVIALLVAVQGREWWARHRTDGAVASHGAAATGAKGSADAARAPAQPAGPATLRMGRLTLTACALAQMHSAATTPAFCADFPVPENRADSRSRTIDLKLAIVKSDSQVPRPDLVAYLAGGPGQSAIQTYPEIAPGLAPLLKHHDLLLLDQRGTGGSHPLACPEAEKQAAQAATTAGPASARRVGLIAACAQGVMRASDPRAYTTTDAIADLEAVRQALGAPRLDLVGVSYGTRVAQHYAMAHPAAVRSIVLDGVVPNTLVLGETFAQTLERSLKLQAAACTADAACKRAFGDWYAGLHALYARLKDAPAQQVTFADPYTFRPVTRALGADTLAGVARLFSYSAATAALLPLAVHEADAGNFAPLLGQSQIITGDLSESMEGGMQLSVICTEDAPLLQPRPQDAGTLLGTRFVDDILAECKVWPHGPMPKDFHAPFKSTIPTLLISGERDPVTPPAFADEVAKGLPNGRALVAKGLGHAEAIDAGCMPRLVDKFVDTLQPKQLDAQCLARLGAPPAFVTYNGAAP